MKDNRFIFSTDVQGYEDNTPRTVTQKLLYKLLDEKHEIKVNPLLAPTPEDMKEILSRVSAINNYLISTTITDAGIFYMDFELAGITADYMASHTPAELAREILLVYRSHWQETRGIDPAPFITMLTARAMQLAVPISIKGYRTLAKIQNEQLQTAKHNFDAQADKELRKARALKNYKK